MHASNPILEALPRDPTPDSGPVHRGGPFAYFVALSCGLSALGAALLLYQSGRVLWGGLCLLGLGAIALRAVRCLADRLRHHGSLPRSHAVLTDALGFRIHCTCRDVAATVFLDPDAVAAGGATRLLGFVENYASRQRVVHLRIGPHRALGLPQPLAVALRLAAGEAAVYVLPLRVASTLPVGEHDLPVTLRVKKPAGTGVRLPGTRRHLYDLWTVRFAAPLTVTATSVVLRNTPVRPTEEARFLSLASVSASQPILAPLQELVSQESGELPTTAE